jgi:hypothetical protein
MGAAFSQPPLPNAIPKSQSGPFYCGFGPIFFKGIPVAAPMLPEIASM